MLPRSEVIAWLPVSSLVSLAPVLLTVGAVALAIALASRAMAVSIIVLIVVGAMHDPSLTNELYWIYALAFVAIAGPGSLALDGVIRRHIDHWLAALHGSGEFPTGVPRVVIVGAGFAGVTCAEALRHERVSVTLIDRHNYHLFQPLLYQVATTMLAPNDIAAPIRTMFRDSGNTRVLLGEVTAVDTTSQSVRVSSAVGTRNVDYDYLVVATGASHSYFGRDEWAPFAPGLKRVEDATEVRRRLLSAFELAEGAESPVQQRALLTFVIVGGGPTGVELAGAIAELARHGMTREFRHIDPASARVLLVQAAPRLLPAFAESMSYEAKRALERIGVEVLLDSRVEQIDADGVVVNGERIASRAVFWAAGVIASPAARWLNAKADSAGRVCVNGDLSVGEFANVFVVGDTALSLAWEGKPVPGLAPAAKQQGAYVASLIAARVGGRLAPPPFRYRHLGSLATIGRKAAVADFGRLRLSGTPAWWLWGVVHVAFLAGLRNRLSVVVDWFWAYLTFRSGTRLITGEPLRTDTVSTARPAIIEVRERLTAR
jgi:NADH dehydrogenase/putative oxidoreductase